jgi:hypothetical protein
MLVDLLQTNPPKPKKLRYHVMNHWDHKVQTLQRWREPYIESHIAKYRVGLSL